MQQKGRSTRVVQTSMAITKVHRILVQLPLPLLCGRSPIKYLGVLLCGCIELLHRYNVEIKGRLLLLAEINIRGKAYSQYKFIPEQRIDEITRDKLTS
ncbi:hypothetical protein Leryth_024931 [Lithospermum erythrorhizon]|nr:hypothetical protein Leryth_024931 [Lithospermum erythrorhizon]